LQATGLKVFRNAETGLSNLALHHPAQAAESATEAVAEAAGLAAGPVLRGRLRVEFS